GGTRDEGRGHAARSHPSPVPRPPSLVSRTWHAARGGCRVLPPMRKTFRTSARLLRALRLGTRRRCPLLQSLWSPRRRLTLAFSSPISYQSASLNSGARREPMGFAGGGGAAADRVDGLHRGCAAPHSPPRDRQFRPLVWRTPRLQLRRG